MKEFKDLKIAVAGTGYVGLSLAVLLAQHHQVTALDIVPEKVEMINNKRSPIRDEYIEKYLAEKELNLTATLDAKEAYFHKAHGKIGTMSMYNFGQNKGVVEVGANGVIDAFREKSDMDGDLINIGFMVFQPELFDLIEGDSTVFEKGPLTKLVEQKELVGYIHKGFWQCMDTLREKQKLEQLWEAGNAPWKVWKE